MVPVVSASNTVVDVVTGLVTTISVVQSVKHLDHATPLLYPSGLVLLTNSNNGPIDGALPRRQTQSVTTVNRIQTVLPLHEMGGKKTSE